MSITLSLLDPRFIALLALTGLARAWVPPRFYVLFGILASSLLLVLAAPATFVAIASTTLFFVYPMHRLIRFAQQRGNSPAFCRILLLVGVGGLIALMIIFKLYRHFTIGWLQNQWLRSEVLGLIGFSYFLFRAISFLHIQTILAKTIRNPASLLFFTLFPPTVTSGPIQRFQDFQQQAANPQPLSLALLSTAAYRITRGYFRKMLLAVILNSAVEYCLGIVQPSVLVTIAAIVLLYLFFYFDFAGYSDIAIGFGLLLGIRVPENFRKPFQATTVSEFWRNWHITLVDWFRDHVFIPLGGMQGSRTRAAFLALLVMVLCGLWHGLTFGLFAWGLWHGLVLCAEALSGSKPVPPALRHGPAYWSRVLWTNARVAFAAIFFLPQDATVRLLGGLLRWRLF